MNQGISTVVYPVKDLAKSRALFRELLGVDPIADTPYYVGFKIGDQDIGLAPKAGDEEMTAYYTVDDIRKSLKLLLDAGSTAIQDIRDVGYGKLVASVKDTDGNVIGLIQMP